MATPTFRDFVELLDREGELARVKPRVSPVLEIAEICDRVCKTPAPHGNCERDKNPAAKLGGKALLFENVEGSDIPVAINTFGSYWRVNRALGTESLDALADEVTVIMVAHRKSTLSACSTIVRIENGCLVDGR